MVPKSGNSSKGSLPLEIGEQTLKHDDGREETDVANLVPNSKEAGTWYYVVDCAICRAAIPFKHAPEGEPILRFPAMGVRCFQCGAFRTYTADLVSHRKAEAPRRIFKRDQPTEARDVVGQASRCRQQDRGLADSAGREMVESKIRPYSASPRRDNIVVAAVSGKKATVFFLSSCFFAAGWVFRLASDLIFPVTLAARDQSSPYGPAALLGGAYYFSVLFAFALFIFGAGSVLVYTYRVKRDVFRKHILMLLARNAFIRSLPAMMKSSAKTTSVTFLVKQGGGALSSIVSGVAAFRSRIKRSATFRFRHYR
jgi:hypothetical protein